jgi:hypothetical protein
MIYELIDERFGLFIIPVLIEYMVIRGVKPLTEPILMINIHLTPFIQSYLIMVRMSDENSKLV